MDMKLKRKVFLDTSAYIDFEDNMYYYIDSETQKWECIGLTSKAIRVLRCLCEHYEEEWVSLTEIFEFVKKRELQVNEYKFQKDRDDKERRNLGKYISDLSLHKINPSYLVIDESRNSQYRLEILDSPFEETQNNGEIKEEACNEINKFISTLDFFNEYLTLSKEDRTTGIDLTFFAGTLWRATDERTAILEELNERHIPCRIIINEGTEVTNTVHKHMKNQNKSLSPPIDNIKLWYEQQKKFTNSLQVRVCPLPLLRSYCHIKNENNPSKDALRIFHYVYGNGYIERNCIQILLNGSQKLEIYSNEFEYLWNISINIKEYLKI